LTGRGYQVANDTPDACVCPGGYLSVLSPFRSAVPPDLVRSNLSCIEQSVVAVLPYATCDLPKGILMGGYTVLEITCKICDRPLDLTVDLYADEYGNTVHERCYVKRIKRERMTNTRTGIIALTTRVQSLLLA